MTINTDSPPAISQKTMKIIKWRLLPFLMILYIVAFIDRGNIGFVSSHLEEDLGISPTVFGLLSGAFFIGYFLFEVPSNMMLQRFGARKWITRIVLTWGLVAAATAFVPSGEWLLVVRVLLGVAEAGFFPGVLLFLTYWFPEKERARTVATFMVALPVATVIAGPVSGVILDYVHWMDWASWRWLFVLEGGVAVLLAPFVLKLLPDGPSSAKWLTKAQADEVIDRLDYERSLKEQAHGTVSRWKVLLSPRIFALALVYFAKSTGIYSLVFFTPTIMEEISKSTSSTVVGLLTALPYVFATIAMVIWARHSDRTGERKWHVAGPYLVGTAVLVSLAFVNGIPSIAILCICIVTMCMYMPYGPFWTLPSLFLTGQAAGSGMAWINSLANLGGFVGPVVLGLFLDKTGSVYPGLFVVAGLLLIASFVVVRLKVVTEGLAK